MQTAEQPHHRSHVSNQAGIRRRSQSHRAVIWLVALACLLLGFNKAGVAGTLGPFVTVIMVLAMPADQAVGLLLPMLIAADSFSVAAYWRQWETKLLGPLVAAAVIGIALGTFVISEISEDALQRLIAVALLLFAILYITQRGVRIVQSHQRRWAMAAGTTAGFTSAVAHAGGPPIIVYLMGVGLAPKRFVATTVALFAMINLLKVPGYLLAGLIDGKLILSTIWGWLLLPVGVALGRFLVDRINQVWFERITFVLLVAGALVLLVD
jgi:uncharacterized membrane protein YfcA